MRLAKAGSAGSRDAILGGPLFWTLLGLAWPSLATALLAQAAPLITSFWMGRLVGTTGLAVTSLFRPVEYVVWQLLYAVPAGVGVLVSRSVGKRDGGGMAVIAYGAYTVAAMSSVAVVAALFLLEPIADLLAGSLGARHELRAYLIPWLLYQPILGASLVLYAGISGSGWTRFGLFRIAVWLGLEVALHPLFITGLGLGVAGASVATAVSYSILGVLTWGAIRRYRGDLGLGEWPRRAFRAARGLGRQILGIGLPAQLSRAVEFVAQFLLIRLVFADGQAAVAGYGLALLVITIPATMTMAVTAASGIMIGQTIGAGDAARARSTLHVAAVVGLGIAGVSIVAATFSRPVLGLMTNDPDVIRYGHAAIRSLRYALPALAMVQVAQGAYTAVGHNRLASALLIAGSAGSVALAHVLGGDTIEAVTLAYVITSYAKMGALALLYRSAFVRRLPTTRS